jgi:hypothetical protein
MQEITVASIRYAVASPSLLFAIGFERPVALVYCGFAGGWRVQIAGAVGSHRYASRLAAAHALRIAVERANPGCFANG